MRAIRRQLAVGVRLFAIFLVFSTSLLAQDNAAISGRVTEPSGSTISNATVSIKNVSSGKAVTVETDTAGVYKAENLVAGDYEITATSDGLAAGPTKVTLAAGGHQTADLALSKNVTSGAGENLPNAPSSSQTQPSLSDLGFPTSQTQGNAQEQALLDKRSHMLKMHQRMGLITAGPLLATVILGSQAGGKSTSSTTRDVHAALGSATAGLYFTTAYYAIFAPKPKGTETRGPIKVHKALALIHGPGMVLTPILGAIAFDQKSKGEKVHGIASAHGPVAYTTAIAYGAAMLAVSVKF